MTYLLTLRAMSKDRSIIEEANVEAKTLNPATYADTLLFKEQFCAKLSERCGHPFHPDNCCIVFMIPLA